MNIVVCIKQVPDTTDVKIDPKTGTLIREGVPSIVNPDDKHAIEEALRLKEKFGGKVTAVSMGPPQAEDALREASAMGVDEMILLCDRAFAGADTWATSYALGTAVRKLGFDLVICGREAIDGDTAQIGPQMAEHLGVPQITYVRNVEMGDGKIICERALEDGYERIEANLPALITVIADLNKPRYPSVRGIVEAYREKEVKVWTAGDINADPQCIGLEGSPTEVQRTFAPEPKGEGEMLEGSTEEVCSQLVSRLKDKNVLR
ncbi:MAG: electron transfer flavoprotein subunit beta [Candidatus Proteinoplasmatales archaeon SG8-5]|nr:MAG: electron transfer flavoprotein subunit beta [Candidatus Proteinoplasmatales archaeon SG8-5]